MEFPQSCTKLSIYLYMYWQKKQLIYHTRERLMSMDHTARMVSPSCAVWFWCNRKMIAFTIISPQWQHSWLKSFHMEGKDLCDIYIQYYGCWWPGDSRSQGINSHGIVLVLTDYSGLNTTRANMYLVQCVTVISALYTRELDWYLIASFIVLTYCRLDERSAILEIQFHVYCLVSV